METTLLREMPRRLPDPVVAWLDTCFALTNESLSSFPLLGSGGNDGVTDFGSLYMQRLVDVLLRRTRSTLDDEQRLFGSISIRRCGVGRRTKHGPPARLDARHGRAV